MQPFLGFVHELKLAFPEEAGAGEADASVVAALFETDDPYPSPLRVWLYEIKTSSGLPEGD